MVIKYTTNIKEQGSSYFIIKALFFSCITKWLTWETCCQDIESWNIFCFNLFNVPLRNFTKFAWYVSCANLSLSEENTHSTLLSSIARRKPPIPQNRSIPLYFFFDMKKPSLRFRKGGVGEDVYNQGLRRPTSDNNLTVHALLSVNIQLLV